MRLFERAEPVRVLYVDGQTFQTVTLRVVEYRVRGIEAHRLIVEQELLHLACGAKMPLRVHRQQAARGVERFVVTNAGDDIEDFALVLRGPKMLTSLVTAFSATS